MIKFIQIEISRVFLILPDNRENKIKPHKVSFGNQIRHKLSPKFVAQFIIFHYFLIQVINRFLIVILI
jgi:hypothetical protein